MSAAIDTTGTEVEAHSLSELEQVIADGLKTFVDVGQALARIRDEKLYRATHKTFEAYCRDRWDFNRAHAHRLMSAAKVAEELSPIGDKTPASEAQLRPLTKLPREQQREAWQEAVETAPEGKVTAKHVAAVVAKRVPQPEPELSTEEPEAPAWDDEGYEPPAAIETDAPAAWECPECGSSFDGHRADADGWVAREFCGHCEEGDEEEITEEDDEFFPVLAAGKVTELAMKTAREWPENETLLPLLDALAFCSINIEKIEKSRRDKQ